MNTRPRAISDERAAGVRLLASTIGQPGKARHFACAVAADEARRWVISDDPCKLGALDYDVLNNGTEPKIINS
jgi:hypothetical protein